MRFFLFLVLLLTATTVAAKNVGAPQAGTVTGHIYCADTNAPARSASVELEPAEDASASTESSTAGRPTQNSPSAAANAQVDLNGEFLISDVKPGIYSVVVKSPGYLSTSSSEGDDNTIQPPNSPARPQLLVNPRVVVEANQVANIDIRLERGASVSGIVHFDDGSPAIVEITVLDRMRSDPTATSDQWIASGTASTDDEGRYRVSGLRSGEYIVRADLRRWESKPMPHAPSAMIVTMKSSITIYSGDTAHFHDAHHFTLRHGEERTGEDITIPLSRMHRVGGVVTAARDGHTVNAGSIAIIDLSDQSGVSATELDKDGTFHLDYVPEGDYSIQISNARDEATEETQSSPARGSHTVHSYGTVQQPLIIHGDISNLNLAVPEEDKQTVPPTQ